MADQISLRKETNLYDDETIKAVNNKVTSQYAVSTTASATVAKTATVDGVFTLFKNARVSVFFQNANTSTSPTLNVAGTGAKPIWAYGGPLSADGNTFNWVANSTIEFVYDGEHWLVADSGAVGLISKYDDKLNQEVIFNKLTNNGAARGIFLNSQTNQLYINMDYLQTGTLKLGGANNGNGLQVVYDANGNEIGRWDKDGLSATGNLVMKATNSSYVGNCFIGYQRTLANIGTTLYRKNALGFVVNNVFNNNKIIYYKSICLDQGYSGETTLCSQSSTRTVFSAISTTRVWDATILDSGTTLSDLLNYTDAYTALIENINQTYCSWRYVGYGTFNGEDYSKHQAEIRIARKAYIGIEGGGVMIGTDGGMYHAGRCICCIASDGFNWYVKGDSVSGLIEIKSSSSKRYKHNITDKINKELKATNLYNLRMKQFVYNNDCEKWQYGDIKGQTLPGFIAEDVAEIYPAAVIHDENGNIESWDERRIIPGMLALIQEQKKQLDEQAERIKKLENNTSFIHIM